MEKNNKPVWLLDVDGVVNACPYAERDFPTAWPESSWRFTYAVTEGTAWPIHYSTALIEFINEMSKRVEIRWHTTWQHDAPSLGAQLGLEAFSVQHAPHARRPLNRYEDPYVWWKMYAAVDVINVEGRPLIWTDDDLGYEYRWEIEAAAADDQDKLCLVTPDTTVGITPKDAKDIEFFVDWWDDVKDV